MELLAVDSEGVTTIIGNDQTLPLESLGDPFAVDNRQSVAYYIDSNNLVGVNLNILNSVEVSKYSHTICAYVFSLISLMYTFN